MSFGSCRISACFYMGQDGSQCLILLRRSWGQGSPAFWRLVLATESQRTCPRESSFLFFRLRFLGQPLRAEGSWHPVVQPLPSGMGTILSKLDFQVPACLSTDRQVGKRKSEHHLCLRLPVSSWAEAPESTLLSPC